MSTPVLRMSEHKCVHTCMNTNSKVHLKMCGVQSAYVFPSLPLFPLTPPLSPSFALSPNFGSPQTEGCGCF